MTASIPPTLALATAAPVYMDGAWVVAVIEADVWYAEDICEDEADEIHAELADELALATALAIALDAAALGAMALEAVALEAVALEAATLTEELMLVMTEDAVEEATEAALVCTSLAP